MQTSAPARRGRKLLLLGNAGAQFCALVRYTVLARLLGPEQLGLAVTLILVSQFFESVSDSGSDRFLVQDADGDAPRLQRLVQLLAVTRGIAIAIALVVFASPIAGFYREPALIGGLMLLAIAPLLMGFMHFDLRRMQRHHDFAREGVAMLVAESISLVVTVIAAWITRDFTASLYGLIARAAAMVIVTQITAERRYEVGYAAEHAKRLARFAWPLMLNGLVLFAAGQGDRLMIGNQLGVKELGYYSATLLLIFYPSAMILRYVHAMQMPVVAAARGNPATLREAVDGVAGETLMLSLAMMAGFAVVAPMFVPLLYGRAFALPVTLIAVIGVLQVCRFIRIWPTTVALAAGRSGIVLTGNIVRVIAFPAAYAGLRLVGGLFGLTLGFVAGELLAFVGAVVMANRAVGLGMARDGWRIGAFVLSSVAILGSAHAVETMAAPVAWAAVLATGALLALIAWQERPTMLRAIEIARQFRPGIRRQA